ncbi:MAG: teichoic acid transporter [Bacteroidota bacterium]|nr:teichoic acid transporter [Bacteroidota bacterium]
MQRLIINTVFARALSTFLNFLIALLIARHAGPAIKGEVTLLVTTIWFFIFMSNILGGQALVYLIPRNKIELLVIPAYLWSIVIALVGFVFLKATHIVQAYHIPSIAVLSLLSAVISIHQTVLMAKKQITNSNLIQIVCLLLQLAGVLACFYFLKISDAYAYIYASLGAYLVTAVISFLLVRKQISFAAFRKNFSFKDLGPSFKYGLLYQCVEILQLLNLRYYFYQLGLQEGSQYLGIFSIGISILEAVWIIPRGISTVHYVSTANSAEVKQEASRTVSLVKISLLLSGLALFAIWLIPARAYTFIFGPGFHDVKHSIRYLFPGILIYSLPIVISSFYLGIGKYRQLIVSNLSGFLALLFFSWLLIPKYVMSGAGLAATLSFTVAAVVLFVCFMMDTKIPVSNFIFDRKDWQLMKGKMKF